MSQGLALRSSQGIPGGNGRVNLGGKERMRWGIETYGAAGDGLVPVALALPWKKRERDFLSGGGENAFPGDRRTGQVKRGKILKDGDEFSLIAAQREQNGAAGGGLRKSFRDGRSHSGMCVDLEKTGVALSDERLNGCAEMHRPADVSPPITGRHIHAVGALPGDRGPQRNLSRRSFNNSQRAQQIGFGRFHLAAVKGVVDLEESGCRCRALQAIAQSARAAPGHRKK